MSGFTMHVPFFGGWTKHHTFFGAENDGTFLHLYFIWCWHGGRSLQTLMISMICWASKHVPPNAISPSKSCFNSRPHQGMMVVDSPLIYDLISLGGNRGVAGYPWIPMLIVEKCSFCHPSVQKYRSVWRCAVVGNPCAFPCVTTRLLDRLERVWMDIFYWGGKRI